MTGPTRPGDSLSDTQRRFLNAVMERLPRDFVKEIYLFAPMKRGGVETGIAVVAVDEVVPPEVEATEKQLDESEQHSVVNGAPDPLSDMAELEPEGDTPEPDGDMPEPEGDTPEPEGDMPEPEGDTPEPEGDMPEPEEDEQQALAAEQAGELANVVEAETSSALKRPLRYTVHTARYRLQLKGPERGRWDFDMVEEADAPLVTVDAVVRGVHRRSGEPTEVERLAPHDLARALGEIPWTSES